MLATITARWETRAQTQVLACFRKRTFDVAVAGLALLVLAPLLALLTAIIVIESRGPVFYRARRAGRGGAPIDVLKFRKMRTGATGAPLTAPHDDRFTRIGAFLARTHLDELPQLLNVLRGDMSIVGPRPEDLRFVAMHPEKYADILAVRPGITGLSQLAFVEEASILWPEDPVGHYVEAILPQKCQLDLTYAASPTLGVDLRVIVWTLLTVTIGVPVAVDRATGRLGRRRRRPVGASARPPALKDVSEAAGRSCEGRPARLGPATAARSCADRLTANARQVPPAPDLP